MYKGLVHRIRVCVGCSNHVGPWKSPNKVASLEPPPLLHNCASDYVLINRSFITCLKWVARFQAPTMSNAVKDMEQQEILFIAGEPWPSHFGKQSDSYLHANKCLSCNWTVTSLGIYPHKLKQYIHWLFRQFITKRGSHLDVFQQVNDS